MISKYNNLTNNYCNTFPGEGYERRQTRLSRPLLAGQWDVTGWSRGGGLQVSGAGWLSRWSPCTASGGWRSWVSEIPILLSKGNQVSDLLSCEIFFASAIVVDFVHFSNNIKEKIMKETKLWEQLYLIYSNVNF